MIAKPIAEINKFQGMSDNGGMFYIDGFSIEKDNGMSSIDENYLPSELVNTGTSGYSNLGNVNVIKNIYPLTGSRISASNGYTLMLNSFAELYSYDMFSSIYPGKVGGVSASGDYLYCQKPDLFVLPSGNVIYSSSKHLSLGVRGLVKTGSGTGKIIDKDGRNFTTLGLASSDKVTNLKTGSIYTITSITTTTSTDDTLNFTAISATDNVENDEFLAIDLTRWNLNYVDGVSGTTVTIPTFKGQQEQVYWSRPIKQYGDQYMILSGNYIALLAADESTMDATYKQLPTGYQGVTFEVNGSMILVSSFDNNGQAHLLLWDGFSDGWNEIFDVSTAPASLKTYGAGWVYLIDSTIYFTDGRNIQKLIGFSDNRYLGSGYSAQANYGIVILKDIMYFAVTNIQSNRDINGILVFDKNSGLTQFKCKQNGKGFAVPYSLSIKSNTSTTSIYSTNNDILIGCGNSLNNLNDFQSSQVATDVKSFMYVLDFQQETQIKEVWLNLKRTHNTIFLNNISKNSNISINYGNGISPIIKYCQTKFPTTTTATNTGGSYYSPNEGDEIEILDGALAGQRTFITGITDKGTSSEAWTISPAVSAVYNNASNLRVWSVKNGETKTVTLDQLSKPVRFNVNFLGSKLYLEVVVKGTTNSFPISINDILLF